MIGDKAKVEICLKLAEKFCQDSETLRGIEEIRSQFDSIVPKEDPKSIDGKYVCCAGIVVTF